MPKIWFEVTVEGPRACSEAVANFLFESGSLGLQFEDLDDTTTLIAYFANEPPIASLRTFCTAIVPQQDVSIDVRTIADEDWADNWKQHCVPQLIGARLCVCPSWDSTPPAGRTAIIIDPGMAFGTGQHASTRGCLELLERVVEARPIRRALDVGTGSGVLAIALVKLGVDEVWAVDIDLAACAIAVSNVERNGVGAHVHVASDLESVRGEFDLIAANLYAGVLQELAPRLAAMLSQRGVVICSGLLIEDEPRVRAGYEASGCELWERYEQNSWVTVALQRKAAQ